MFLAELGTDTATRAPTYGWTDKQDVTYAHNGISPSPRERHPDTGSRMVSAEDIIRDTPVTKGQTTHCMVPPVWGTESAQTHRKGAQDGGHLGQGQGRRQRRELLFNEYRASVLQDEKSSEDDGGDGSKTVNVRNPLKCRPKW